MPVAGNKALLALQLVVLHTMSELKQVPAALKSPIIGLVQLSAGAVCYCYQHVSCSGHYYGLMVLALCCPLQVLPHM